MCPDPLGGGLGEEGPMRQLQLAFRHTGHQQQHPQHLTVLASRICCCSLKVRKQGRLCHVQTDRGVKIVGEPSCRKEQLDRSLESNHKEPGVPDCGGLPFGYTRERPNLEVHTTEKPIEQLQTQ